MGEYDVELPGDEPIKATLSEDGERVLAVDRSGHELTADRYGPVRQVNVPTGTHRWRTKIIVDECKHDGTTPATRVVKHGYGTAYCPLCDASQGKDGLWRVIEDV